MRKAGIAVWLDEWEILVEDSVLQKIEKGLNECQFLVIWLTYHSVSSGWVQREWQEKFWEEIQTNSITVFPLLAENCKIPILLKDKKYAVFRRNYSSGLKELLKVLRLYSEQEHIPSILPSSCLVLEYFSIDRSLSGYQKEVIPKEYYESMKFFFEYCKKIGIPYYRPVEKIYKPGTPLFRSIDGVIDDPIFVILISNCISRKIILHTIELEVIFIVYYCGVGDSEILKPLAGYDVEVPRELGIYKTQMIPQISIAAGDIVSFHIRLIPTSFSGRSSKDYSLNIKIYGGDALVVETGVFNLLYFSIFIF